MTEQQLQSAIADEMRASGWVVVRLNSHKGKIDNRFWRSYHVYGQGKNSSKGLPDLVGFKDNKALLVEVKLPGNGLRESQEYMMRLMNRHGTDYYMISSIKEIQDLLKLAKTME